MPSSLSLAIALLLWIGSILSTVSDRADTIISHMTLEEKIGQMVQLDIQMFMKPSSSDIDFDLMKKWLVQYQVGSLLNSPFSGGNIGEETGWNASYWRSMIINIHQVSLEANLKAPILYGIDSIHGAGYISDAVVFPQSICQAASFDASLVEAVGAVSSRDSRAAGIPWMFAPVLGLGLQPLWARFEETYGEDPYLAAQMGAAAVTGMQKLANCNSNSCGSWGSSRIGNLSSSALTSDKKGDSGPDRLDSPPSKPLEFISRPHRAAATMKHFIGYSAPADGHDRAPVMLPDRVLRQLYLPAFQAAVDAGVLTAMESYQEVGGIPMISSREYLTNLLRKEMGFGGLLVSDYAEIVNLHQWHKVAATPKEAVQMVLLQTSLDMSMVPLDASFYAYALELVREGIVPEHRIDCSVRRILALKQQLGLFDDVDASTGQVLYDPGDPLIEQVGQPADWELSLNVSRASVTLLKNDGHTLPLHRAVPPQPLRLLVTGPTADCLPCQSGSWTQHWQGVERGHDLEGTYPLPVPYTQASNSTSVTILRGLQMLLSSAPSDKEGGTASSVRSSTLSWPGRAGRAGSKSSIGSRIGDANSNAVYYVPGPSFHDDSSSSSSGTAGDDYMADMQAVLQEHGAGLSAVVVCLGEDTYAEKPGDIDDLSLSADQLQYVTSIQEELQKLSITSVSISTRSSSGSSRAQAGEGDGAGPDATSSPVPPIVLVLVEGRPRLLKGAVNAASAVLHSYRPGPAGGLAVAEAVLGSIVPSGRLPFTYPRHSADGVYPYHRKPGDQCTRPTGRHTAAYVPCEVEWPFGAGLSYTEFSYTNLTLACSRPGGDHRSRDRGGNDKDSSGTASCTNTAVDQSGWIDVSVTVTNEGSVYTADHVVMLFVTQMFRSVTPEIKLLKRFKKVRLSPGESVEVAWRIDVATDLRFVGLESRYILEGGEYRLGIGSDVDCRAYTATDLAEARYDVKTERQQGKDLNSTVNSLSSVRNVGAHLCAAFTVQLTKDYHPVCEQACAMWSSKGTMPSAQSGTRGGICGIFLDPEECTTFCSNQEWSWDYVKCIERYFQEDSCIDLKQLQCFDILAANGYHAEDVDQCPEEKYSLVFIAIVALFSIVFGMAFGTLVYTPAMRGGAFIILDNEHAKSSPPVRNLPGDSGSSSAAGDGSVFESDAEADIEGFQRYIPNALSKGAHPGVRGEVEMQAMGTAGSGRARDMSIRVQQQQGRGKQGQRHGGVIRTAAAAVGLGGSKEHGRGDSSSSSSRSRGGRSQGRYSRLQREEEHEGEAAVDPHM